MRKIIFVLIVLGLSCQFSCDDGDIITVEFDFDETFQQCDGVVFYKTKSDPSESLSLKVTDLDFEDLFVGIVPGEAKLFTSDDNTFNYRTYSNTTLPSSGLFCSDIPPSDIDIREDYESTNNIATFTVTLIEDDNDGIPAEFEDLNDNGNLEDDDSDGDGIPNYLDQDDDGDNVFTKDEKPNYTVADGLANAQNTDGEDLPDYLDTDDDNDGVLTRDEESIDQNQDPRDDVSDPEVGPDYLNKDITEEVAAIAYREHTIHQSYTVTLLIESVNLGIITQDFDFGTLSDSATTDTRTETPDFN